MCQLSFIVVETTIAHGRSSDTASLASKCVVSIQDGLSLGRQVLHTDLWVLDGVNATECGSKTLMQVSATL